MACANHVPQATNRDNGEDQMDAHRNAVEFAEFTSIGITPKKLASIKDARGMRLRVETGSIWVTREARNEDVCLRAGESYCILHDGPAGM